MKSEALYKQLKDEIMRWAVQKRHEKVRGKDDMEIGEMQEPLEATWEGSENWYEESEWDFNAVGKGKGKQKGNEEWTRR